MGEETKIGLEVLDDFLSELFGFHILESTVSQSIKIKVKPKVNKKGVKVDLDPPALKFMGPTKQFYPYGSEANKKKKAPVKPKLGTELKLALY